MVPVVFLLSGLLAFDLVEVIIVAMKHHDQMHLGEEKICLAYTSIALFSIEGSQAETWKQELTQGPWKCAAYWLA